MDLTRISIKTFFLNCILVSAVAVCPPRPVHLHLRAGTVSVSPGPAGDAGEERAEQRGGK